MDCIYRPVYLREFFSVFIHVTCLIQNTDCGYLIRFFYTVSHKNASGIIHSWGVFALAFKKKNAEQIRGKDGQTDKLIH